MKRRDRTVRNDASPERALLLPLLSKSRAQNEKECNGRVIFVRALRTSSSFEFSETGGGGRTFPVDSDGCGIRNRLAVVVPAVVDPTGNDFDLSLSLSVSASSTSNAGFIRTDDRSDFVLLGVSDGFCRHVWTWRPRPGCVARQRLVSLDLVACPFRRKKGGA